MYAGIHASEWRYWELGHKATFDGVNRLIKISPYVYNIDVKEELYSDWKEWMGIDDNPKYPIALRTVGGDSKSETERLGDSYFLINNWKIQPWSGDYTLTIDGNLYVDNTGVPSATANTDPFVAASDPSNIKIQQILSSIVNTVVQTETEQVPALTDDQLTTLSEILAQATSANTESTKARKIGTNLAEISNDGQLVTIYDDDGTTILHQFVTTNDENNVHTREPL